MDCRTKKEGKSADGAAVALYMATRSSHSEVVIAAADKDQAKDRVLRAAKFAVERGPLSKHAKTYRDVIEFNNGSTIAALPMDWQGVAGGNYSAIIFDELHTYVYENQRRLWDELVIPPTQPHGCRWVASYAGWDGQSELLQELWGKALEGEQLETTPPIYRNPELNMLALIDLGEASWRMPWMTDDYIQETQAIERPNTFRRIWLNEWVNPEDQFITSEQWAACYDPTVKSIAAIPVSDTKLPNKIVLGADASTTRDSTALVGTVLDREKGRVNVVYVKVWRPKKSGYRGGKPTIDLRATLDREVRRLHKLGIVKRVVYDSYQLHSLALGWEDEKIPVMELPQTARRTEADQALYDGIIGRTLAHFDHPDLNEHMLATIARETPRGFRLDKTQTSKHIDAAVALSMSHWGAIGGLSGTYRISFLAITDKGVAGPGGVIMPSRSSVSERRAKRRKLKTLFFGSGHSEHHERELRQEYANVSESRKVRIRRLAEMDIPNHQLQRQFSLKREVLQKILEET
jgi:hypothetical protein